MVLAGGSNGSLDFRRNCRYAYPSFYRKGVIGMTPEEISPEIFAALCATEVNVPIGGYDLSFSTGPQAQDPDD